MAKSCSDRFLDGALNILKNNDDIMVACSAEPTDYTELTSTYALADVAIASGDFTNANGDTSGRKTTVGAKTGVTVDTSGTVTHVGLGESGATALDYVTTTASQAVASGGTVDFGAWDIELADPA